MGWSTRSPGGDAPREPRALVPAESQRMLNRSNFHPEPQLSHKLSPSLPCFCITQGQSLFFRANPLLMLLGFEFMATGGVEPPSQMVIC